MSKSSINASKAEITAFLEKKGCETRYSGKEKIMYVKGKAATKAALEVHNHFHPSFSIKVEKD